MDLLSKIMPRNSREVEVPKVFSSVRGTFQLEKKLFKFRKASFGRRIGEVNH